MRAMKQNLVRTIVLVLVITGSGTLLYFTAMRIGYAPSRTFDSVRWKEANPRDNTARSVRCEMVQDLLARHDFQGWSRAEVVALLGKPTENWSGFPQWDVIYVLGPERRGVSSLDDEALGFKFNDEGYVVKYGLSVN